MTPGPLPRRPDLVVVGGGTAGIVGARTAAAVGAEVVLVEPGRPGGDCLWTGCVPSKALIAIAGSVHQARRAIAAGHLVAGSEIRVDFPAVMRAVDEAIATIAPNDSVTALEAAGVRVLTGTARFLGADRIAVDGTPLRYRQALLATGSAPAVPDIPGLRQARYLTSETLWSLRELPAELVILGGGSIGCELGQAFARLGARVTVIEADSTLLPGEDPQAAAVVLRALRDDGVDVRLGQPVTSVDAHTVTVGESTRIAYTALLVAVGRTPRTHELNLDTAEVRLDAGGYVVVDDALRTSNPRIWAAGDVTGPPQFTHTAGVHGSLAATNAVLGLRRSAGKRAMPRVTFTSPEVAAVGVTPVDNERGLRTVTITHNHNDRAIVQSDMSGFTTLVMDRRGRLQGATVVSPRAGETIGEATLAVQSQLRTRDVAAATHAYPTFSDSLWNGGISDRQRALRSPLARLAVRALLGLQRWRGDRTRAGRPRSSTD